MFYYKTKQNKKQKKQKKKNGTKRFERQTPFFWLCEYRFFYFPPMTHTLLSQFSR